jgi:hypothetical protein
MRDENPPADRSASLITALRYGSVSSLAHGSRRSGLGIAISSSAFRRASALGRSVSLVSC